MSDAFGVPAPSGWIGTTAQWTQGLGLAFAVSELVLLFLIVLALRRQGLTPGVRAALALAFVPLPVVVVFLSYAHGLPASMTVKSCGACHVMTPFVNDLRDPSSKTLAAVHYKNNYIQANHCYTCHSDYGMAGTLRAKLEGLGHVVRYTSGRYTLPIKIAHPFPNARCLACHAASQKFRESEGHPKEDMPKLLSGETSCIDCHGPAHPGES